MKQTLDAVYENGVFRPLKSPEIKAADIYADLRGRQRPSTDYQG